MNTTRFAWTGALAIIAAGCDAAATEDPTDPSDMGQAGDVGSAGSSSMAGASAGGSAIASAGGSSATAGSGGSASGAGSAVGGSAGSLPRVMVDSGNSGGGSGGSGADAGFRSRRTSLGIAIASARSASGRTSRRHSRVAGTDRVRLDPPACWSIYIGTVAGLYGPGAGVWKSTDCGATWTKVSTGKNGDAFDKGGNWTFNINPASLAMYTNSGYGTNLLYRLTNGGVDWTDVTPKGSGAPGFAGSLRMEWEHRHPASRAHLAHGLREARTTNTPTTTRSVVSPRARMAATPGFEHYHLQPKWGAQVQAYILKASTWMVPDNGLWLTTDSGATWPSKAAHLPAGGHSAGLIYRTDEGSFYVGTNGGIIRSTVCRRRKRT